MGHKEQPSRFPLRAQGGWRGKASRKGAGAQPHRSASRSLGWGHKLFQAASEHQVPCCTEGCRRGEVTPRLPPIPPANGPLPLHRLQPLKRRAGLGAPRGLSHNRVDAGVTFSLNLYHQPNFRRGAGHSGLLLLLFATSIYNRRQRKGALSRCHDALCALIIYCHNCSRRFFLMHLRTPPD